MYLSPLSIVYGNISVSKQRLKMYLRAVQNPWSTLFKTFFFKPPWDIMLRTNEKKRILDKKDLFETVYTLNRPSKGPEVQWTPKDSDITIKLKTIRSNDGYEVFDQNIYGWLPVADTVVVDIGASIGDSPLYFASKGAKHVFAFEADVDICNIAVYNIARNSCQDLITLENRRISGANYTKGKMMKIEQNYSEAITHSGTNKDAVMPMTLEEIIKERKIEDAVLKIDCEGCEYEVILCASADTIRHFSHIQMEYHFGMEKLKKRLIGIGYEVKVSRNRYSKSPNSKILMKAGDLYATRIGK